MEIQTLKIEKEKAKKIFKEASESLREILISTFGADTFKQNVIDQIKTFSDAYDNADRNTRAEYDCQVHFALSKHIVARLKLILIAKVLRGDWEPDFSNTNQQKWFPVFKFSSGSGFDFSGSHYDCGHTATVVGSRLCFPNKQLADYFGKQFLPLHREHLS